MPAKTPAEAAFRGWRVAWAAFVVAAFGWGVSFYGPPVFLFAVHEARGWPVPLVSAAVTLHFLVGAGVVALLPAIHARMGVAAATRLAGLLSAAGLLGWAFASAPWLLFLATLPSGAGWAMSGSAAINAMIAPWFVRRRPAALSTAYNGASVGGVVFSPLWVALIAGLGFGGAAALVGAAMALALWVLAGRYFAHGPAAFGQVPDGQATAPAPARPAAAAPTLPGGALWTNRRFVTLALATSIGLIAQIGLIAHLFSLLALAIGPGPAGFAAALMTVAAIAGRTGLGWLMKDSTDRRIAAALNYAVQVTGSLVMLASGGTEVGLMLAGMLLFGLGLGNLITLPPLIAQRDFAIADLARVVALVTALSQAAYAFAPALFGLLRVIGPEAYFLGAAGMQALAALVVLAGRDAAQDSAALRPSRH